MAEATPLTVVTGDEILALPDSTQVDVKFTGRGRVVAAGPFKTSTVIVVVEKADRGVLLKAIFAKVKGLTDKVAFAKGPLVTEAVIKSSAPQPLSV